MGQSFIELEPFYTPFADAFGLRHGFGDAVRLFALAAARWGPIVALAPFLGGKLVPAPVKMALIMLLSLIVLPFLSASSPVPLTPAGGTIGWWAVVAKEVTIGVVIGFTSTLVFWGAEMGGRLIDTARGTTTANLMIPQVSLQSSILGDVYFQLFVVLYLISGSHRVFFSAVVDSYHLLPPAQLGLRFDGVGESMVDATAALFVIALKLIAPALIVVIFLDIVLGVANRMAPQLNVFFLSLSLKASLASLALALSLYFLLNLVTGFFSDQHRLLERLMLQLPAG